MLTFRLNSNKTRMKFFLYCIGGIIAYNGIRMLTNGHFSISQAEVLASAGFFVGIALFLNGFSREKLRRKIKGLPTSRVRSMALGTVELNGMAQKAEKILVDPIYGKQCVFFSIEVREKRGSGKNSSWVTIYSKSSDSTPFYLKDKTGRVLILPHGAENQGGDYIHKRYHGALFGSGSNSPEDNFMKMVGGNFGSKVLEARIIREDMPVYVLGFAKNIPNEFRHNAGVSKSTAARKLKDDKEAMSKLDLNNDGQVDSMEWDMGVLQHKRKLDAQTKAKQKKEAEKIFTQTLFVGESKECQFVIARDEKELVSAVARSAIWQVISGPFITAGSAWYLTRILF